MSKSAATVCVNACNTRATIVRIIHGLFPISERVSHPKKTCLTSVKLRRGPRPMLSGSKKNVHKNRCGSIGPMSQCTIFQLIIHEVNQRNRDSSIHSTIVRLGSSGGLLTNFHAIPQARRDPVRRSAMPIRPIHDFSRISMRPFCNERLPSDRRQGKRSSTPWDFQATRTKYRSTSLC